MYKNNKGSTALIISLVFGLIALSIGGYFGYRWYQNKLLTERIEKIDKVTTLLEDIDKDARSFGGDFNPSQISTYKSTLSKIDDNIKDLKKLEVDKEIEKDVNKCTDEAEKFVDFINKGISIIEKAQSIQSRALSATTESEVRSLEVELKNLDSELTSYRNQNTKIDSALCKKAIESSKDLVKELEAKK